MGAVRKAAAIDELYPGMVGRGGAQNAASRSGNCSPPQGPKDHAAGQAIANRMEATLRAGTTMIRGINDGISLIQTADGGLDG